MASRQPETRRLGPNGGRNRRGPGSHRDRSGHPERLKFFSDLFGRELLARGHRPYPQFGARRPIESEQSSASLFRPNDPVHRPQAHIRWLIFVLDDRDGGAVRWLTGTRCASTSAGKKLDVLPAE